MVKAIIGVVSTPYHASTILIMYEDVSSCIVRDGEREERRK